MMHTRSTPLTRHLLAACALGACLAAPAAYAANGAADADMSARYKMDVERCNTGQTNQDKATCLREAGAALQEARRNRLLNSNQAYDQNQIRRCDALPAAQRDDCLLQMSGQNSTTQSTVTHGSVAGGGVLRETTITIPGGPVPAPSPSPGLTPAVPAPATVPAPSLTPAPAAPMPATPAPAAPGTNAAPMPGTMQ